MRFISYFGNLMNRAKSDLWGYIRPELFSQTLPNAYIIIRGL